jgi:hypothetical protein
LESFLKLLRIEYFGCSSYELESEWLCIFLTHCPNIYLGKLRKPIETPFSITCPMCNLSICLRYFFSTLKVFPRPSSQDMLHFITAISLLIITTKTGFRKWFCCLFSVRPWLPWHTIITALCLKADNLLFVGKYETQQFCYESRCNRNRNCIWSSW